MPASFPCAAAKPTFVSLTFRGGVCKVTVVCLNGAGVQFQDPGGAGYLPVAAGYVRRGVGAGRGRCLVQQIDGMPARFALVLSSCTALLLVVFTATDHLCFIRAGSAPSASGRLKEPFVVWPHRQILVCHSYRAYRVYCTVRTVPYCVYRTVCTVFTW